MAAALFAIESPLGGWWTADLLHRGAGLTMLVGGGLAVYGGVIVLSGAAKIGDVTGLLRRERPSALTKGEAKTDNPLPPETLTSIT